MPPFQLEDLSGWALGLLSHARVGHLAVIDDRGWPRVLPVTFALSRGCAWTAVDQKPKREQGRELARVRWLRQRGQATLETDAYDDDWTRLAWVQLIGHMAVLEPGSDPEAIEALAAKYPQYRDDPPGGQLLRLSPERAVSWRASERG